jgi:hypothetical protein
VLGLLVLCPFTFKKIWQQFNFVVLVYYHQDDGGTACLAVYELEAKTFVYLLCASSGTVDLEENCIYDTMEEH